MYACCDQVPPAREKTYTAPARSALRSAWFPSMPVAPELSPGAPTASVRPSDESATAFPNHAYLAGFEALM